MFRSSKWARVLREGYRQSFVVLAAWLLLSGIIAAQDLSPAPSRPDLFPLAPSSHPEHVSYVLVTNDVSATAGQANAVADKLAGSDAEAAVAAPSVPASTQGGTPTADSDWHFTVSPYLWLPWVYGSIGANGHDARFYATPGDLLSHFRFGLLGVVEPDYKRLLMPIDLVWLRLGENHALVNTPNDTTANIKADIFILTPKVGYRLIDWKKVKIDALTGFRYWHLGQNLAFTPSGFNFSRSQNWVDPLVGGRITGILSPKVAVTIGGDVGGWGVGSQSDYQAFGLLSYRIKPKLALEAAYRYLAVNYRNGDRIFDAAISGPVMGVTITIK